MTVEIVCDDVSHWAETTEPLGAHALLADAPYELNFMGSSTNGWDNTGIAFAPSTWTALARHLLPGAFLMVFASTRGYHRLACALEDAGLIIHPCIVWVQSQGWPKATRIDTALDAAAGVEQEVLGCAADFASDGYQRKTDGSHARPTQQVAKGDRWSQPVTAPVTPMAQAWAGHRYGRQMLKPSCELIAVAQKPYEGATVESIVKYGAGALNIDAGRVSSVVLDSDRRTSRSGDSTFFGGIQGKAGERHNAAGRWPSNLSFVHTQQCRPIGPRAVQTQSGPPSGPLVGKIGGHGGIFVAPNGHREHIPYYADADGMEQVMQWMCAEGCPVAALDRQAGGEHRGGGKPGGKSPTTQTIYGDFSTRSAVHHDDIGQVSRFFPQHGWADEIAERLAGVMPAYYCGKASATERSAGLPGRNIHNTIKPLSLCRWLASLLLPPSIYAPRRLLIPFAGVFSEVVGALHAGFEEITAVEREAAYVEVGRKRLVYWTGQRGLGCRAALPLATDTTIHTGEQLSLY